MAWRRLLPGERPTTAHAVLSGAAGAVVGLLVRFALQPFIGSDLAFITFFPALLGAAIWGGLGGGLLCLVLSGAVAAALILPRSDVDHLVAAILAFSGSGGLLVWAGAALASTVRQLRESQRRMEVAEADLHTMVNELSHRSRNGLTVVMAIVSQSARKVSTSSELADVINGRLGAMADAQVELLGNGGTSAALRGVMERTLSAFDLDRFTFDPSPPLHVTSETASALALLTHELATNAVKHGALSSPQGRVQVAWEADAASAQLRWREFGGPPIPEAKRDGFGTRLLASVLVSQGGRAERRFEPEGVVCDVKFPHITSTVAQQSHVGT